MKIALIRGSNLNPFEMQSYLPLAAEHELFGFATPTAPFAENGSGMTVRRLRSPAELVDKAPARLRRSAYHLLSRGLGAGRTWLFGLEGQLRGMDILHSAETANAYSFQALLAKRKGTGALVVTCWENLPHNFEQHPLTRYMKLSVRNGADHFIAITSQARDCLIAEGVEAFRISVIPAGINLSRFCPGPRDAALRNSFGISAARPVILFMGRLAPEKGVYDLLQAVSLLHQDSSIQPELLLVGNGRERAGLIETAKRLGLREALHLQSHLPYEKTPAVYRLADVFALPSRPTRAWEEQFGMVLVEAMACGLPVVATNSGAIPEVVGDAGVIVPPASPPELAKAIGELLQNADLRRRLSAAGVARAKENFCHVQISRRIGEVYRAVVRVHR